MENISGIFDRCRGQRRLALILYATMGYPSRASSRDLVRTMADCGADLIEIGVPFSDPVADGPAIQHSSRIALEQGVTLAQILDDAARLDLPAPLVLMSYLNPLLAYGLDRLCPDLRAAGIRGLVVPDLPVEEAGGLRARADAAGCDLVLLAAPTSSPRRLAVIGERTRGFVYCVSCAGTTGARTSLDPGLNDFLATVRQATTKPVAVGFGISDPSHVRGLFDRCDGVIVGSRIVEALRNREPVRPLIASLREACEGG